jgi:Fanconi anemia group M protein
VEVLVSGGISAKQFVGKKDGVTKKIQEETIADFREGKFDVLVASCIGEEGLDIPAVDAVIFYEPVPSEIRAIQRRGRAGRLKEGRVIVLMTKGTRDEYYYHAANNRETRMKKILGGMQRAKKKKSHFERADTLASQSAEAHGGMCTHENSVAEQKATEKRSDAKPDAPVMEKKKGQTRMTDF